MVAIETNIAGAQGPGTSNNGPMRQFTEGDRMITTRAFSSEVETGSRKENTSKQESGAPFRFHRNGKGSRLAMFGTLVAALLASSAASAQLSDEMVKIGVLTDMNGPASTPTGQGSVTAAQMAVDDFGGTVLGKPISVIVGDHQLKADIGAGLARRWYDTEQVDLIVDVPVSAVGLAVQNVANEKKKLFITHSTGAADFHGKFCTPYALQWVFDTRAL